MTDGIIFESLFAARRYSEMIGEPPCPVCIVPNGLYRHEFYEARLADDAADFVFVGELRQLKGVDILLAALAAQRTVYPATAVIVGSGPDEKDFKRLAQKLGLEGKVTFVGPLPATDRVCPRPLRGGAVARGVLPLCRARGRRRADAADRHRCRRHPRDRGRHRHARSCRPGDIAALAGQMRDFLANPKPFLDRAVRLQKQVAKRLTVERMTNEVVEFYLSVAWRRAGAQDR